MNTHELNDLINQGNNEKQDSCREAEQYKNNEFWAHQVNYNENALGDSRRLPGANRQHYLGTENIIYVTLATP